MPLQYIGHDKPFFNWPDFCMYCAEHAECEIVEGNPVCEDCFYKYLNRDWKERTDLVEPEDLVFGNDWQQKKTL